MLRRMGQTHSKLAPVELSKATDTANMATTHNSFSISLSVQKGEISLSTIRITTHLNGLACSSNNYPRGYVYQSAVWPEALREVQQVSVTIELGSQCASADRVAVNQIFAGLVNYLDAASKVEFLRIQLPDADRYQTTELLEIIQPVAILARQRIDVALKLVDVRAEVLDALVKARRSHSRSDDTIEQLYSKIRIAARAAARLNQAGLLAQTASLNHDMAGILTELDFVGPRFREKVEMATEKVDMVLARTMEGV